MTTTWFILARAVHIGACLLFFGVFTFDRLVATAVFAGEKSEADGCWRARIRFFNLILLPVILFSGMLWFAMVAVTMSGQPPQFDVLKIVWDQTEFGTVSKLRLAFWLAAVVVAVLLYLSRLRPARQIFLSWLQLLLGGVLLGSLAWAGHGQEGSTWHLVADVLHLLVSGLWPAGLVPFALVLHNLRRGSGPVRWDLIAVLVRRFSAVSLGSVLLLVMTGYINSWFLVGSFSNLFQQPYGRWLVLKIVLLGFSVAIGAMNLLRLKPRLTPDKVEGPESAAAAAQLQFNVEAEMWFGIAIVVAVAILGILPPANH